jgi:hypothetical protein
VILLSSFFGASRVLNYLIINLKHTLMKRFFTLVFLFLFSLTGKSQTMNFEALDLPIDTFWNGSDLSGKYLEQMEPGVSDTFIAYNQYDTSFGGYWSGGFAISTMTDDSTGNFTNLYSSIAGGGYNSDAYAVVSAADTALIELSHELPFYDSRFMSMYVSNSTYAYHSMLNGDAFSKKFGGTSGDDQDYFFIRFYFDYGFPESHADFYLADFRASDNSQDYILDEWVFVDLNDFPNSEYVGNTIKMKVFSSDTSIFGINTPAYFCMDELQIAYPGGISDNRGSASELELSVKQGSIHASMEEICDFQLIDLSGKVLQTILSTNSAEFDTAQLPQGVYIVQARNTEINVATKVWRW